MKKMHRNILLAMLMVMGLRGVVKSQDYSMCKQKVLKYIRYMQQFKEPEGNRMYFFKMEMETHYEKGSPIASYPMEISVLVGKDYLVYETPLISIYQDSQESFIVSHASKEVRWNDKLDNPNQAERFNKFSAVEDSLILTSRVINCEKLKEGKKEYELISFSPSEEYRQKLGIKTIKVKFDLAENRIREVTSQLDGSRGITDQKMDYEQVDFNYKGKAAHSVRKKLLNNSGELQAAYKEYKLIDERKKN